MKIGSLFLLVAAFVALALTACSQPTHELREPALEAQFGPPNTTEGTRVTSDSAGRVFATSNANSYAFIDNADVRVDEGALSRYDRNGNLLWELDLFRNTCPDDGYYDRCVTQQAGDVASDQQGTTYTLVSSFSSTCDGIVNFVSAEAVRADSSGQRRGTYPLGNAVALAADAGGNFYTVGDNDTIQEPYGDGTAEACDVTDTDPSYARFIRKYSTSGTLLWERRPSSELGMPKDVAVASNGDVYMAGDKGLSRYNARGTLLWTKSGSTDEVIASGSGVVTRTGLWVRAYTQTGTRTWSTFIGGLSGARVRHIGGDTRGNVYVAGGYSVPSQGTYRDNAFVRKLNSSGESRWTRTFGTSEYDWANGVASYDGSEVYLVGTTAGPLSPANYTSDGFLYKVNGAGSRVWVR